MIVIYMLLKTLIKKNKVAVSIILFMIIFYSVNEMKPAIFFDKDGSLKQFGLGYKHKTVVPLWLFAILTAILCYIAVSYLVLYLN